MTKSLLIKFSEKYLKLTKQETSLVQVYLGILSPHIFDQSNENFQKSRKTLIFKNKTTNKYLYVNIGYRKTHFKYSFARCLVVSFWPSVIAYYSQIFISVPRSNETIIFSSSEWKETRIQWAQRSYFVF